MDLEGTGSPSATWVIEPRRTHFTARLREVWRHRHLLNYFGRWYLAKTYARTVLGWSWIILRPLITTVIGTLVFSGLLNVRNEGAPYFLFYLVGMAAWQIFDNTLMWSTRSLELNRRLITRVYFPRLVLPVAAVVPVMVEFLVSVGLIVAFGTYYFFADGVLYLVPGPGLLATAGATVLIVLLGLSIGLWTSVPGARARDVRFTVRYVLGFWFFVTPVIYPLSSVPPRWQWLMALNPMAACVETFKWGVFGAGRPSLAGLGVAAGLTALILVSGLWFFGRAEAAAVDRL